MAYTVTIEDVKVKEIVVTEREGTYVMNVLYATVDSDGKEYIKGWEPIKTGITAGTVNQLNAVFLSLKNKLKAQEGL